MKKLGWQTEQRAVDISEAADDLIAWRLRSSCREVFNAAHHSGVPVFHCLEFTIRDKYIPLSITEKAYLPKRATRRT